MFELPKIGKKAIELPHFPTAHQAFIFRAYEYFPPEKIADILGTTPENIIRAAGELGLPDFPQREKWIKNGYITIIKRMWHKI